MDKIPGINNRKEEYKELTSKKPNFDSEYHHPFTKNDGNNLWKNIQNTVDNVIDNYRDNLVKAGVSDGEMLESFLRVQRARMLESESKNVDYLRGYRRELSKDEKYHYIGEGVITTESLKEEFENFCKEDLLQKMEINGEITIPKVMNKWVEPKREKDHLPTEETGKFLGKRGDSAFIPNNKKALDKMLEFGESSVNYKNNKPDFSPFTKYKIGDRELYTNVEIGHMTDNRTNPKFEYGRRPKGTSHDPNYDLGNFFQADNELLKKYKEINPDATVADVVKFRKENKLVWHELDDGMSMQLVPEEIHSACPHSGGVSEMNVRMAYGDIELPNF